MVSKADRTRQQMEAAFRERGRCELRCVDCDRILLRYTPPIGLITMPCRRCGTWNRLTTTEPTTGP